VVKVEGLTEVVEVVKKQKKKVKVEIGKDKKWQSETYCLLEF
jgi:hypothetical protein